MFHAMLGQPDEVLKPVKCRHLISHLESHLIILNWERIVMKKVYCAVHK